jgi:hypothetical protein
MRRGSWKGRRIGLIVAAASFVLTTGFARAEPAVTLQPVKYGDLAAAVRALRGKIVVVDVWAEY